MRTYKLVYDTKVRKQLKKLDPHTRKILKQWIDSHLVDTANPRAYGKPLRGEKSEYWRYRVGSYRIIARIEDDILVIIATDIAHRKHVYRPH